MVKRIIIISFAAFVLFLTLIILLPTEKGRFKQDIRAFKQAVEQENIPTALYYISPEYEDRKGMNFELFSQTIESITAEFNSLDVSISGLKVFIDSTDDQGTFFAHCSMGLKLFARYQGDRTLLYGGIVKPASVKAWFKKTAERYQVYDATY